jgi:hypothetical protein
MPEISISTNTGGWFKAGFNVKCPEYICKVGKNIPQNVNEKQYLPVVLAFIRDIRKIFPDSKYFHLGSDERVATMPCFEEASLTGMHSPTGRFDVFENNLIQLLNMDGVNMSNVVRWQNSENTKYSDRVGTITQCRSEDCRETPEEQWFATVDLRIGGGWQIYQTTRRLAAKKPEAILADFDRLDAKYFNENKITLRMLAFAMGNMDLPEMNNRTEFEHKFITLCAAFKTGNRRPGSCASFAKSNEGTEAELERESEDYRDEYCDERTDEGMAIVYRDEICPYYLNE